MKVRDILTRKGEEVFTVGPGQSVDQALGLLVDHDIGSLVVVDDGTVHGILTERDILRLANRDPTGLGATRVSELMTRSLIIGVPDDEVYYVMEIMTRNRVRHLPVLEDDRLVGIVSIGDVVNHIRRDVEAENRYLKNYVQGMVR